MKSGTLVKILDDYGKEIGTGLFIDKFVPLDRRITKLEMQPYMLHAIGKNMKDSYAPNHWHYEVIWEGELRYLHISSFSLLPL